MNLSKKSGWRKRMFLIAAFTITLYAGLYIAASNSTAYLSAVAFLKKSDSIVQRFGEIRKTKMKPFNFSFRSDGSEGAFRVEVYVVGEMESGVVKVYVKQRAGQWSVEEAHAL